MFLILRNKLYYINLRRKKKRKNEFAFYKTKMLDLKLVYKFFFSY